MRPPFADSPEFLRLIGGADEVDLTLVALEIARDAEPGLDFAPYLDQIDALAARVRDRCPSGWRPRQVVGQINWVLFVEECYRGNVAEYDDPRNSHLAAVIDRKLGIPISLAVLYRAVAARAGLPMAWVNLPFHFVLGFGPEDDLAYVDAFHAGAILTADGCRDRVSELAGRAVELTAEQLAPCGPAVVVARMLRNLKANYLRTHDYASALPVPRRLAALRADDPSERRDLGMVCLRAERPGEAITPFSSYLRDLPDAEDAPVIRTLLETARREVARWN